MKFKVVKTADHPKLDGPIVKILSVEAATFAHLIKSLKIGNKEQCDLKAHGKTTYVDQYGGNVTLELPDGRRPS
jgi:hypothetical protein